MSVRGLPQLLIAAALLLAFGGPAGLLHQRLAHGGAEAHHAGHAHASANAAEPSDPEHSPPATPDRDDCPTCHLLLHTGALPPVPAPSVLVAIPALPRTAASVTTPHPAAPHDRPPVRGPPRDA